jgi:TolB protein
VNSKGPFAPLSLRSAFARLVTALLLPLAPALAACGETPVEPVEETSDEILILSSRDGAADHLDRPLFDLYRMNAGGTGAVNLTGQPANYVHLSLSPNGRRVAFAGDRDGGCDIWTVGSDGAGPVRITGVAGNDGCNAWPRWSPDGNLIAFTSNRGGRQMGHTSGLGEVFVMSADGSDPRNVSHALGDDLGFNVWVLGWSPDGKVVFVTDGPSGGGVDRRVYLVQPDGTGLRPLFDRTRDHSPAWSPDGSQVAFISERDGRPRLYLMNADGTDERPLTDHGGNDWLGPYYGQRVYDPWSPDGSRIVFHRDRENEWGIHVIDVDGSGLRRLTDHPSTVFNGWAPDGERIAFTFRGIHASDVYIMDVEDGAQKNLTAAGWHEKDAIWLPRP